jgi:hypothetical protein
MLNIYIGLIQNCGNDFEATYCHVDLYEVLKLGGPNFNPANYLRPFTTGLGISNQSAPKLLNMSV